MWEELGAPPPPFCLCHSGGSASARSVGEGAWGRGAKAAAVLGKGPLGYQDTMISAAQLLDELMGRDRNLAPDEKRSNVRWDHESVSETEPPPPGPQGLVLS